MSLIDDFQWFQNFRSSTAYQKLQLRPIAYFCAEFALTSSLNTYSGGLGILAGDVVREAFDQHIPVVGVGILYKQRGWTQESSFRNSVEKQSSVSPDKIGLEPVYDRFHKLVQVKVPIQDRHILVKAFRQTGQSAPVYFLTTDIPENDPRDRAITDQLYVSDKEKRLHQEMVLGIGGLRLLEVLEIHPSVFHLNEGHSAMLALEIAQHEMRERLISFSDALVIARHRIVFTNHTLVAAGNDVFSNDLASSSLASYAQELMVPVDQIIQLGKVQESSLFSMTMLSLRMADRVNAVSQLHAQKAAEIWTDHPIVPITNGIHIPTWDKLRLQASDNKLQIFQAHQQNKKLLLDRIQKGTGKQWSDRSLIIGWARRLVGYKRPLAIFSDPVRLATLCSNPDRPVRIVVAGNIHSNDEEGKQILEELHKVSTGPLSEYVALCPEYNMEWAQCLTAGCDVWLNTPAVGFEACGTSGMKAALNGGLLCSTKDGWMAEIDTNGLGGWTLESTAVAEHFYATLEKEMIPMYFGKVAEQGAKWSKSMSNFRELILNGYSATRMFREYIEKLYLPAIG